VALRKSIDSLGPEKWTVQELGAFYRDHRSDFVAHAAGILKDRSRSEEVVQDAVIRVILAAPELSSKEHALGYMRRTIENLCKDIFRLEGRRPNLVALDSEAPVIESIWVESKENSDGVIAAEDASIIRNALSLLSPAERAALIMWELESRSSKEIARELGIKESAVRHTLFRARSSLRRVMSELIIDEERGLTALDLLSHTYKRASQFTKKSSRAVMTLLLVFFAFLGFNSLPVNFGFSTSVTDLSSITSPITAPAKQVLTTPITPSVSKISKELSSSGVKSTKKEAEMSSFKFEGLDSRGIPLGFTVTDSNGELGSLYSSDRSSSIVEEEWRLHNIVKTDAGAANIFISQRFFEGSDGLSFDPSVSYGRSGSWAPLVTTVKFLDSKLLLSGNYLVSAIIQVESEAVPPIVVPVSTMGRDLPQAPKQVVTRLVLSRDKSHVLAQAIEVVEKEGVSQ
jgi:RNA polymerase sigma factor (sigma-70 family)